MKVSFGTCQDLETRGMRGRSSEDCSGDLCEPEELCTEERDRGRPKQGAVDSIKPRDRVMSGDSQELDVGFGTMDNLDEDRLVKRWRQTLSGKEEERKMETDMNNIKPDV